MACHYLQSFQFDNEVSAGSKPVNLKLIFPDEVVSPVYTGKRIRGKVAGSDGGNIVSLRVIMVDGQTNQQVTTGPAASATVKIVLLPANFGGSTTRHGGVWTPQDFEKNIVVKWGKKNNLLLGNLTVVLKNGIGTVGYIRIKHDSKPLKRDKFRLGAMVVDSPDVVKEAITGPFEVKDRRNEPKDSRRLLLDDKLWHLKNIGKRGRIFRCLKSEGVLTVRDFLDMYDSNPGALQEICGVKGKRWETMVRHAKRSRIENVFDGYGSVGSTSQQSNHMSMIFDSDGYIPQPYNENNITVRDYEECGLVFQDWDHGFEPYQDNIQEDGTDGAPTRVSNGREGRIVLAKKRWTKVRATLWFSLVSFLKAGLGVGRFNPGRLC